MWVLDPCPQVEGANYDWFVLAVGRGGRLWIEGSYVRGVFARNREFGGSAVARYGVTYLKGWFRLSVFSAYDTWL